MPPNRVEFKPSPLLEAWGRLGTAYPQFPLQRLPRRRFWEWVLGLPTHLCCWLLASPQRSAAACQGSKSPLLKKVVRTQNGFVSAKGNLVLRPLL